MLLLVAVVAAVGGARRARQPRRRIRSATSRSTTSRRSISPGTRIFVRYALDLAEIPTFQEGAEVRRPGYAATLARKLELRGRRQARPARRRVASDVRASGRRWAEDDCASTPSSGRRRPGTRLDVRRHAPTRAGSAGARSSSPRATEPRSSTSSVPATSRSDELRAYPRACCARRSTSARPRCAIARGRAEASAPTIGAHARARARERRLRVADPARRPLARRDPPLAADRGVLGLGARADARPREGARRRLPRRHEGKAAARVPARCHGDGHAHGRRLRARARDAAALAVHRPRAALPVADAGLGLLVVAVGAVGAATAAAHGRLGRPPPRDDDHASDTPRRPPPSPPTITTTHGHDHHHGTTRADDALTSRGILGVGVAAGLLPCPSALVVLLSAIAIHRIGFGFALIAAFSLGLAATITGIGLVAVLRAACLRPRLVRRSASSARCRR